MPTCTGRVRWRHTHVHGRKQYAGTCAGSRGRVARPWLSVSLQATAGRRAIASTASSAICGRTKYGRMLSPRCGITACSARGVGARRRSGEAGALRGGQRTAGCPRRRRRRARDRTRRADPASRRREMARGVLGPQRPMSARLFMERGCTRACTGNLHHERARRAPWRWTAVAGPRAATARCG